MTPTILALIVLGLVVLDFVLDLQLFGFSLAGSFSILAVLKFYDVQMENWQWTVLFVLTTTIFIFVTRFFVKTTDNTDINKY